MRLSQRPPPGISYKRSTAGNSGGHPACICEDASRRLNDRFRSDLSEVSVTILLETPDTYGLRTFAVTDPGGHYVLAPSNRGGEPNPLKVAVPLIDGPALCQRRHLTEVKA